MSFQVKIWFQNRRAKERKLIKKKLGLSDGSGGSVHSDPGSVSPLPVLGSLSPTDIHSSLYPPQGIKMSPSIRNISNCDSVRQWTLRTIQHNWALRHADRTLDKQPEGLNSWSTKLWIKIWFIAKNKKKCWRLLKYCFYRIVLIMWDLKKNKKSTCFKF